MAVSPDLLLNIKTPETRSRASAAKADSASQASRQEASRFAEMYARERQGKPVERSEAPAKPVRDTAVSKNDSQENAEAKVADKPALAEGGNDLPPTDEQQISETDELTEVAEVDDGELDPLLMLGMGAPAEVVEAASVTASEFLFGLQRAQAAAGEGEALPDELMAGQKALLQNQATNQQGLQMQAAGQATDQPATDGDELFASMLQASGEPTETTDELELALAATELDADAPGEARQNSANAAASRLNPLSQAIAQQVQQSQRATLVPGQPVQMQQSGWSEAVVDRVMWLSSQNLKSAEIQLDPAELGRMEVRIDMNKDQAQVTFLSPHAGVRDALESQMQRLRDMFSQQGMSMDVNVSDQSQARGWQGEGGGESRSHGTIADQDDGVAEGESAGVLEVAGNRVAGDRGLVDYYA